MQESTRLFGTGRNDLLTISTDDTQYVYEQLVKELAILVVLAARFAHVRQEALKERCQSKAIGGLR